MINITLLHVHTYTHTYHTCWVCTILIEGERRDFFFFGMDHNTWCQLFSRTVGKHRGVAIPHPSPPQTVLCQCYQNKWHILTNKKTSGINATLHYSVMRDK